MPRGPKGEKRPADVIPRIATRVHNHIPPGQRPRPGRAVLNDEKPQRAEAQPGLCRFFRCACCKSNPDILVVQPAENWAAKNVPGPLDGARDRRILLQGSMRSDAIVQHDDGTPTGSRSTS